MAFCEKCGGQITEDMKFCDKCGSVIDKTNIPAQEEIHEETKDENVVTENVIMENVSPVELGMSARDALDKVKTFLPAKLVTPGDKTLHWIGFGSLAALALTYLICFFAFMADMCTPIAIGAIVGQLGVDGASSVWMIVYFILGLFPLYFAITSFKYDSCKKLALISVAFSFVLTLFSLIVWGICDAGSFMEAGALYAQDSAGVFAWYVLNDCLSEAWYVKLILPLITIFCFGMDYIVNKEN